MKYLVDANAILSFLTDRNPDQQKKIGMLFANAVSLKDELVIIENVITETVYVLQAVYHESSARINMIITDLLKTPGITYERRSLLPEAINHWPEEINDYGDALLAAAALELRLPVVTFDKSAQKQFRKLGIEVSSI